MRSPSLAPLAAVALTRALAQLCARAAAAAAPAADLRDVSGAASPAQLRAIATCSQLHEVHRSFAAQLPKLPPAAAEVRTPLRAVHAMLCTYHACADCRYVFQHACSHPRTDRACQPCTSDQHRSGPKADANAMCCRQVL